MKILTSNLIFCTLLLSCLFAVEMSAQDAKVTVSRDPEFERMLNEKRRINSSITVNDRYKIQIYNGDSDSSKKVLSDFKRDNRELDGTIVFSTPAYKVWVGNFKTRIEAERNLEELKRQYPSALLIKPNK